MRGLANAPPLDGVGDQRQLKPPPWFTEEQRGIWEYALDTAPIGLVTRSDRDLLIAWTLSVAAMYACAREMNEAGLSEKGSRTRRKMITPSARNWPVMVATVCKLADHLGYSPGARSALQRKMLQETMPLAPDHVPSASAGVLRNYLAEDPTSHAS